MKVHKAPERHVHETIHGPGTAGAAPPTSSPAVDKRGAARPSRHVGGVVFIGTASDSGGTPRPVRVRVAQGAARTVKRAEGGSRARSVASRAGVTVRRQRQGHSEWEGRWDRSQQSQATNEVE